MNAPPKLQTPSHFQPRQFGPDAGAVQQSRFSQGMQNACSTSYCSNDSQINPGNPEPSTLGPADSARRSLALCIRRGSCTGDVLFLRKQGVEPLGSILATGDSRAPKTWSPDGPKIGSGSRLRRCFTSRQHKDPTKDDFWHPPCIGPCSRYM